MSIKPEQLEIADPVVWSGGVVEFEGRDAGAFLQAQLMNDVRDLADGDWQWSGWLTPKGRVVALGILLRHTEHRFWLLLPDYPAARLADELRRYVFRSKLGLALRDDLVLLGTLEHDSRSMPEQFALSLGGERRRTLWVSSETSGINAPVDAKHWAMLDLAQGLPRLAQDALPGFTPQMLGLDRLRAFSVKKGCYPGQEIVARTHFLGKAKRGLQRLTGTSPTHTGEALHEDGGPSAGEVLCAATFEGHTEALAVLPLDREFAALTTASGSRFRVTEFAEGLAR
jgi:folate-binding protein YgfZ